MLAADVRAVAAPATGVSELPVAWKQIVGPVEPFLEAVTSRLSKEVKEFDGGLASFAEYALTGQGKQLRSALVGLVARTTGKMTDHHTTVAVIIELVHLATLVHDDVMDEAEIRRGRLTLAANWGNETAVLFGDCLFAQALKLAASFPTPEICRAVAMATKTVCSGEILQNQQRHNFHLPQRDYFKVLKMKTGELFALSCDLGAFLNGSAPAHRAALRRFGLALGTAYQVYDDCLDLFGSEAVAGKSLGTDLIKGKPTLPVLLFWEQATVAERAKLESLIAHWKPGCFGEVVALLNSYGTLKGSLQVLDQYLGTAREALRCFPEGRAGLLGVTDYLWRLAESLAACG